MTRAIIGFGGKIPDVVIQQIVLEADFALEFHSITSPTLPLSYNQCQVASVLSSTLLHYNPGVTMTTTAMSSTTPTSPPPPLTHLPHLSNSADQIPEDFPSNSNDNQHFINHFTKVWFGLKCFRYLYNLVKYNTLTTLPLSSPTTTSTTPTPTTTTATPTTTSSRTTPIINPDLLISILFTSTREHDVIIDVLPTIELFGISPPPSSPSSSTSSPSPPLFPHHLDRFTLPYPQTHILEPLCSILKTAHNYHMQGIKMDNGQFQQWYQTHLSLTGESPPFRTPADFTSFLAEAQAGYNYVIGKINYRLVNSGELLSSLMMIQHHHHQQQPPQPPQYQLPQPLPRPRQFSLLSNPIVLMTLIQGGYYRHPIAPRGVDLSYGELLSLRQHIPYYIPPHTATTDDHIDLNNHLLHHSDGLYDMDEIDVGGVSKGGRRQNHRRRNHDNTHTKTNQNGQFEPLFKTHFVLYFQRFTRLIDVHTDLIADSRRDVGGKPLAISRTGSSSVAGGGRGGANNNHNINTLPTTSPSSPKSHLTRPSSSSQQQYQRHQQSVLLGGDSRLKLLDWQRMVSYTIAHSNIFGLCLATMKFKSSQQRRNDNIVDGKVNGARGDSPKHLASSTSPPLSSSPPSKLPTNRPQPPHSTPNPHQSSIAPDILSQMALTLLQCFDAFSIPKRSTTTPPATATILPASAPIPNYTSPTIIPNPQFPNQAYINMNNAKMAMVWELSQHEAFLRSFITSLSPALSLVHWHIIIEFLHSVLTLIDTIPSHHHFANMGNIGGDFDSRGGIPVTGAIKINLQKDILQFVKISTFSRCMQSISIQNDNNQATKESSGGYSNDGNGAQSRHHQQQQHQQQQQNHPQQPRGGKSASSTSAQRLPLTHSALVSSLDTIIDGILSTPSTGGKDGSSNQHGNNNKQQQHQQNHYQQQPNRCHQTVLEERADATNALQFLSNCVLTAIQLQGNFPGWDIDGV